MKRVITGLSLLLLLLCGASAQSISQYEYWTDDDYANREVGSTTGGDVSLSISTATLEAGVHFLNFRACRDDGVWGNFYRYLYYIPTLTTAESGDLKVEYWLDDDLAGVRSETPSGGNLSMTIDVSALKPGVHYFNCTPMTTTGERGNSERYLFYVPQTFDLVETSPIKGFEYWLDDDYANKQVNQSGSQNPVFTIGIGNLSSGVHYFNCRAFNERGEYGNPVREMFYIPDATADTDVQLAGYEYWLDDDYAHCVKGSSTNTEQAYTIDISQLASGVHYFNYWPIDAKGRRGNVIRQLFYRATIAEAPASDKIDYEYWIDDNTSQKVTGTSNTGDLVFNIDVSGLSNGTHTFNFKAKDVLEQWGPVYAETFEVRTVGATCKLTYIVDGEVYKTYNREIGANITPEPSPTKEGYTFSGWSEIPATMPDHDVTITGTFTINKYKLTYKVDGEVYKTYEIEYGSTITPETAPTKEGYTFSGWSWVPTKMPAEDVTVTGTFTKGAYSITYKVDGEIYKVVRYDFGTAITPEAAPTREGYTFSGWSWIPTKMPAEDVTVTGTFTINSYKLTYMIGDEVYKETTVEYGATITAEPKPEGDYQTFEWVDLPETMPAHDVVVHASFTTGIDAMMATQRNMRIYSADGKQLNTLQRGLNIIVYDDGTVHKIFMK